MLSAIRHRWRAFLLWRLRRKTMREIERLSALLANTRNTLAEAERMTSAEQETADVVSRFSDHDGWSLRTVNGDVCGWTPRGMFGGDVRLPRA